MIKKCLFPIAGYGTRFLPITKSIPKEMIPIINKPLIHYAVEEALAAGCKDLSFVTSKYKKAIEDYFDSNIELENILQKNNNESILSELNQVILDATYTFIRQKSIDGLGHAILGAKVIVEKEDAFAVILADDLSSRNKKLVLSEMMILAKKFPDKCIIAIREVPDSDLTKYGTVSGSLISENVYCVEKLIEKPSLDEKISNLAILGRYILTHEIFEALESVEPDKKGELQITDALSLLAEKDKVIAYKYTEKVFDCGCIDGFVDATNYFYKKEKTNEI